MLSQNPESTGESTLVGLWYSLRPHQWYKQIILFIPLLYSGYATRLAAWIDVVAGVLVFSAVTGCVYIFNDVFDREADRNDPVKRHRPIACGQVPVGTAVAVATGGSLVASAVAFWLDHLFLVIIALYVLQNFAYSAVLKHVFLIDLFVIGTGFVLRAMAGVVLISAPLSPWLILTVFLAAILLASGKRRAELVSKDATSPRGSLEEFTREYSLFLVFLAATTVLVVYSMYTFFARRTEMMLTIPFAYYSVLRFSYLAMEQPSEQVHELIFQRDMLTNFTLWGIATVVILYLLPPS